VVATRVSAIPEFVGEGENGLLVESGDANSLAAALERLIRAPALRADLGAKGQARLHTRFDHAAAVGDLARRFGVAP